MELKHCEGRTPEVIMNANPAVKVGVVNVGDENVQVSTKGFGDAGLEVEITLLPGQFYESTEPKLQVAMSDPDRRSFRVVLITEG